MGLKDTVQRLSAENVAIQTLLIGLMHELVANGRTDIAHGAFNHAERALEIAVLTLGDRCPDEYSRRAMESLEQLRRMAFPAEQGPISSAA